MAKNLFLITNPGSSSRKYALYDDDKPVCTLHFEYEGDSVICTVKTADGTKKKLDQTFTDLSGTVSHLGKILESEGYLGGNTKLKAIIARAAAPGDYFTEDHVVDDECLWQLELAKNRAPLHVPVIAKEIEQLVAAFEGTPVLAVSDSGFHNDRPASTIYYAIDTRLADKTELKRYGFHGLSVGSIVEYMKKQDILPEKLIVCHIGSGSSVTGVLNGKSYDTTMGYTPLEGVMMSTRCGNMDVAAAFALKRQLGIDTENGFIEYLSQKGGLRGVSGKTDDMREILKLRDAGDEKALLAYEMYVSRIQSAIGRMAAVMDGVDAIVFTATIGERSDDMREWVCRKLHYLGFNLDQDKNLGKMPERHTNIGTKDSKPIWVIRTDEFEEMIRRAKLLLAK